MGNFLNLFRIALSQVVQLSVTLKAQLKAELDASQPAIQKIMDLIKEKLPELAAAIEGNFGLLDGKFLFAIFSGKIQANLVLSIVGKFLKDTMKQLANPDKMAQAMVEGKVDVNVLAELALKLKGRRNVGYT
jgi:hypothetical protein